jgi:hypothetical protein
MNDTDIAHWQSLRTPAMHWGAAMMFHALAHVLRERTTREH